MRGLIVVTFGADPFVELVSEPGSMCNGPSLAFWRADALSLLLMILELFTRRHPIVNPVFGGRDGTVNIFIQRTVRIEGLIEIDDCLSILRQRCLNESTASIRVVTVGQIRKHDE